MTITAQRGFQFTVSNKGVSHTFNSQREAIQWARPLWSVGRTLQVHVTHVDATSSVYLHCVTYRKERGQRFGYIGEQAPRAA